MKRFSISCTCIAGTVLLLWGATGCIQNDIPYPTIPANFESFTVEEAAAPAQINTDSREVVVALQETANPAQVHITGYTITEGATITPVPGTVIDLTSPQQFTLRIYQDYVWTVRAEQPIERRFVVKGQIGNPIFNTAEHIAIAYVTDQFPLDDITIDELKLGPSGATTTPDPATVKNFTTPQTFTVRYRDVTETWTVTVMQSDEAVSTLQADGWTKIAWLKGSGIANADNGFQIRKADESEWQTVNKELVTQAGGIFSARVPNLTPDTEYAARAYSDGLYGAELTFRTDPLIPLDNASLDFWNQDPNKPKLWYPWGVGETPFWDTGNKGATTLGDSNTSPSEDICPEATGGLAGRLESRWIVLKLAAGNLFAGKYLRTDVTDGVLSFGQPYTARPTRLKGYYKYTSKPVNRGEKNDPDLYRKLAGKNDTCSIYMALSDRDEPYEIRTKPSNRQLFDKNDPGIIAYGEFSSGTSTSAYQLFTIDLEYRATNRQPKYIIIVASSSKYGDYFVGGEGSVLYLDLMSLDFD